MTKKDAAKPRGGINLRLVDEVVLRGASKGGTFEFALVRRRQKSAPASGDGGAEDDSARGGAKRRRRVRRSAKAKALQEPKTEKLKLRAASEHQARRWCAGLQQRVERAKKEALQEAKRAECGADNPNRRASFFVPHMFAGELARELTLAEGGLVGDVVGASEVKELPVGESDGKMLILDEVAEEDESRSGEESGAEAGAKADLEASADGRRTAAAAATLLAELDRLHERTVAHRDDLVRLLAMAGSEAGSALAVATAAAVTTNAGARAPGLTLTPTAARAAADAAPTPVTRKTQRGGSGRGSGAKPQRGGSGAKERATLGSRNARLRRKADPSGASSQKRGTYFGAKIGSLQPRTVQPKSARAHVIG